MRSSIPFVNVMLDSFALILGVAYVGLLVISVSMFLGDSVDISFGRLIRPMSVEEDHPKFDCETMGNSVCGPSTLPTSPVA